MKVSALVSLVLAATFVSAGCDRKSPQPEPSKYDAEFDGPPQTVAVYVDPLLLADQTKISEGSSAPPPAYVSPPPKVDVVPTPPPTGDTPDDTVTEIKAAIDHYAAAIQDTENLDKLSDFIAEDQDVNAARTLLEKMAALVKKEEALRQLVQDKLGIELPPKKEGAPVSLPGSQLQAAKENLKFLSSDDVVLVTGPRGMKVTFVKADNRWKVRYGAMDRKMLVVSVKLLEAFEGALDEMTSGIEDGTVTKENFEAKKEAIGKEKIGPIMAEMMQLIMPMMGGGDGPPGAPTRKPEPPPPDEGGDLD